MVQMEENEGDQAETTSRGVRGPSASSHSGALRLARHDLSPAVITTGTHLFASATTPSILSLFIDMVANVYHQSQARYLLCHCLLHSHSID